MIFNHIYKVVTHFHHLGKRKKVLETSGKLDYD